MDTNERVVRIVNADSSLVSSLMLQDIETAIREVLPSASVSSERGAVAGAKCELILALLIGIASSAAYDVIRNTILAVMESRAQKAADFDKSIIVEVDGRRFKLTELGSTERRDAH